MLLAALRTVIRPGAGDGIRTSSISLNGISLATNVALPYCVFASGHYNQAYLSMRVERASYIAEQLLTDDLSVVFRLCFCCELQLPNHLPAQRLLY